MIYFANGVQKGDSSHAARFAGSLLLGNGVSNSSLELEGLGSCHPRFEDQREEEIRVALHELL